jgi:hypothetical protein
MISATLLIACPSCSCHAFARESHCPGCGALLRAPDGSLQRTAGAAFLGLTLAFAVGCSGDTTGGGGFQTMSTYGTAASGGYDATSVSSVSSATGTGGAGGFQTMSTYGTAASGGFSGSSTTAASSATGTGGAGGAGGSK